MATAKGRALICDNSGTPISGEISATVTEDGNIIEYDVKSDDGPSRDYDGESCTIQLEGIVKTDDTAAKAVQTARYAQTKLAAFQVTTAWGAYTSTWTVESCEITGATGDLQRFTATLKSNDGYTFTAS